MEIQTMSRKQRAKAVEEKREQLVTDCIPRAKTFTAPPCCMCEALRNEKEETRGKNYSRVTSKQGRFRYCKCDFCGHTWKEIGS